MYVPGILKQAFARMGGYFPNLAFLAVARKISGIPSTTAEMKPIIDRLKRKRPCNFLVFGLGNDSSMRHRTRISQWKEFHDTPERLTLDLPADVLATHWDAILVDAPSGWNDISTGRMKSIFAASQMADAACDVFVHDCDREVEQVYSDRYLKPANLLQETGLLRHYRLVS